MVGGRCVVLMMTDVCSGGPLGVNMTRNGVGVILAVDDNIVELLGWRPDQLIGTASSSLLHPEDQASGIAAWVNMVTAPGDVGRWRGRYQTAGGSWQWVETINHFENFDRGVVFTSMTAVTVDEVGIEEELRSRTQLLTRLSHALPVGLFEIDVLHRVQFTNDRLHLIAGVPLAATIEAQLMTVIDDDQPVLQAALTAVLADRPVDDVEIRLEHRSTDPVRVCLLSLRPLTDASGAVSGAIGLLTDVTDKVRLRQELEIRASVDQLTSCLNRAATLDVLAVALTRPDAVTSGTAVVYIDLDGFKLVNDVHGHAVGDRLLVAAADRLRRAIRYGDFVGRLGGDEFLVVCPDVDSAGAAVDIAERLESCLHDTIDVGPSTVDLRASVGVAFTTRPLDADSLIAHADAAMYQSKRNPTSKVTLYQPTRTTVH